MKSRAAQRAMAPSSAAAVSHSSADKLVMRAPAALALALLPGCAGLVAQSAWGFSDPAAFPGFTHTFSSWTLMALRHDKPHVYGCGMDVVQVQ
eukprot:COSAG04_NODE_20771_length_387_cov_0.454861_1_plen_92_part_01